MNSLYRTGAIPISNSTELTIAEILSYPEKCGGKKRIHIGAPGVQVTNEIINNRIEHMKNVGYNYEDYFIEFNNDIFDELKEDLKLKYNISYEHACAVIVPPGQCMPVHSDTYSYLMRYMKSDYPSISYNLETDVRRCLIFLTDWKQGQSLGADNKIQYNWKQGDVYQWGYKAPHWCSNASMEPIVFFEITGLEL